MNELALVERFRAMLPVRHRGLVLGIGDDCAIFRPRGSREDLVFTSDQTIEGTHFRRGLSARQIGDRAVRRALSDIAAMGAEPRFCLISIAAPARFAFESFYRGVQDVARKFRFDIAGGDLTRARRFSCDVVFCGSTPRGQALRRDMAQPGDFIFVSGRLGRNASSGYRLPLAPRLSFGKKLRGRATACMDISDGLVLDLHRLCIASRVSASLLEVPFATNEQDALYGGEDYELLYTGPGDLPGIPIGVMESGTPGVVSLRGQALPVQGWDPFA